MIARRLLLALAALAGGWSFAGFSGVAPAATYTWDGGGSGYWDTTASNFVWLNGTSDSAWSNSPVSDAAFGTEGATVYVDAPVTVQNMSFSLDGDVLFSISGDSITLGGTSPAISVAANASVYVYSYLAGTSGLIKSDGGTLELDWPNSYGGTTTVAGGILRVMDPNALPGGTGTTGGTGNLVFNGGIIELGAGDFTRALGTGAGQVQFTGSGGFSALGGNRVVNLGGASAPVTWGASPFVPAGQPLMLGSPSDDSTVDFQNPINLNNATRTVQVTSGFATVDAQLSGVLSGTGTAGLTITGNGVLELSAGNSYPGATTVLGGVLRLSNIDALPGGTATSGGISNLVLNGGVIELAAGDFTAPRPGHRPSAVHRWRRFQRLRRKPRGQSGWRIGSRDLGRLGLRACRASPDAWLAQ